jgi:hypothetical protein
MAHWRSYDGILAGSESVPALLNTASILMCPHGGQVQAITTNVRAKAGGDFALRASDTFLVAGCPFTLGPVFHPCLQVQWVQPAARSKALGDFTLTEASVGFCIAADQAVQGTVLILLAQPHVAGE